MSSTTGKEVVYYGGNKCGEASLTLCCGSYTQSLRAVVAPSIVFPCIMCRGPVFQSGYWWTQKEGAGQYPIMEVWIDGKRMERIIAGEEWSQYSVRHSLLPGTHTIDICFTNGRGDRDILYVQEVNIGSISLKLTDSLYDRGTNNKADTWFDGVDLISDETRKKIGYDLMRWTGALRFSVYVETSGSQTTLAPSMSQTIPALSSKIYVYPNPWQGSDEKITFVGVVEGAMIDVYNMAGEKVFEKVLEVSDVINEKYLWKPENNAGQRLASGIYLYVVRYGDEIRVGKMGIVR